jgi:hypothetical protein
MVARGYQSVHLANDLMWQERTAVAADAGDYAEGAAIVATVLNFEVRASAIVRVRSVGACGFEDGSGEEFGVGENVGDEEVRALSLGGEIREGKECASLSG